MILDTLIDCTFVHAPPSIDPDVLVFCQSLNPDQQPVYLEPMPFDGAVSGECYANVEKAIALACGGDPINGWLIWMWPGVFIEAEHHMVMGLRDGIVDVTPPADPLDKLVMFLPDPDTPFDVVSRKIIQSRYQALAYDREVHDLMRASKIQKAMHGENFGVLVEVDAEEYRHRAMATVVAKNLLLQKMRGNIGRNSPCLCGSGNKYKNCHMP